MIQFAKPNIGWLGNRNTVVMSFLDEWVRERMEELSTLGFKQRFSKKKTKCRLPMSIHSSFLDPGTWMKFKKFNQARVVEEVKVPFDNAIGAYAHLPKGEHRKKCPCKECKK